MMRLLRSAKQHDLATRLRGQDRAVWEALVEAQYARIFNLHLRLSGDREVAADLTQETFAVAYQSAHSFAGRSRPSVWLYGVALNLNRNWYRHAGRTEPPDVLDENLPDPEPTTEELAELRERSALVCQAVQRLPEIYRRVVVLRYYMGVSAVEIAESEGVEAGTVRWRLHHAMQKLWAMLQPTLGEEMAEDEGANGELRLAP